MQRQARFGLALLAIPLVIAILAISAWAVDAATNSGRVPRNTTLAGHDIGTLSAAQTREAVAAIADEAADRQVTITTPAGATTASAADLGLVVDQEATVDAAMDSGGSSALAPIEWLMSFGEPSTVQLQWALDPTVFDAATQSLQAQNRVDAAEPNIRLTEEGFVVVPGTTGKALDMEALTADVEKAAGRGSHSVTVEAAVIEMPPEFPDSDAQAVADQAEAISGEPFTITIDGKTTTVEPETLRNWLAAVPTDTGLTLQIDQSRIESDLATLVGQVGTPAKDVGFEVAEDGSIQITDGVAGTGCCAPDSVQKIVDSLQSGQRSVELMLTEVLPAHDRAWAEGLGLVEPISSFTTNHACCESRVKNIHRISDLIRGYVIPPGETLSINDTIGKRTHENGFFDAPVIYNGKHDTDVGGGISQFATTLFNASFYGGLDFGEYQSHSEWISRYPYGVEATLSFPHPDLQIRNTTPYGVLVWPTYTDTSVTITLYSTKWVTAEKGVQYKTNERNCTRVTTERLRTYPDGRQETDTVFALYRKQEGVGC